MIAFASVVGDEAKYRRYAMSGLRAVAEGDSLIVEATTDSSIFSAYNEVLEALCGHEGLEALVLLHEDAEIVDPEFCAKVRRRLADPDVAVVGVVGARDVRSLSWWEGEGRGRVLETRGPVDFGGGTHAVDTVDGLLMVLSPWAVGNLRFDAERFTGFHGYDADLCFQARAAGRQVLVDDLAVVHHTKGGFGDMDAFRTANEAWRDKWLPADGAPAGTPPCPICTARITAGSRLPGRTVVACEGCGLGVTVPPPEREIEGDGIWEEQYGGNRMQHREHWLGEADVRLGWVRGLGVDGALVDVGCGTGELPFRAAAHGFRASGIEPSEWAAEQARLLGVGYVAPDVATWQTDNPGQAADVVTLFHVLEHVHEPLPFLRDLRSLVRPGGHLFVEVPNFNSRDARKAPVGWTGPAINDHVFHYTPATIARLLAAAGFELLGTEELSYESYDHLVTWQQRLAAWDAAGNPEPSRDLLRALAVRPLGDGGSG